MGNSTSRIEAIAQRVKISRSLYRLNWLFGILLLVPASSVFVGCGNESPAADGRLPVAGKVTSDGRSIVAGLIQFHPETIEQVQGAASVIRDGQYSLTAQQGLTPGRYQVEIQPASSDSATRVTIDEITGAEVPVQAVKISRSNPLAAAHAQAKARVRRSITVTAEGPNTFDFDLSK